MIAILFFLYYNNPMKEEQIKKIPYGVANYERLVQKNCYFVDKTMYLPQVENAGDGYPPGEINDKPLLGIFGNQNLLTGADK